MLPAAETRPRPLLTSLKEVVGTKPLVSEPVRATRPVPGPPLVPAGVSWSALAGTIRARAGAAGNARNGMEAARNPLRRGRSIDRSATL